MTAFAVDRKRRWDTAPRRRRLFLNLTRSGFQIADLIKFDCFKTRIGNRQRIPRYGITGSKMVFGVSAFPPASLPILPRTLSA
jgi:hypothetical protein